jgi:cytochrome c-type biogenesis protein CcmE
MTRKSRRLVLISSALALLALAAGLVLFALRDTIVFFYTPSEIDAKNVQPGTRLRLGGLVKEGSVVRGDGKGITFSVRDGSGEVRVTYNGLLPDLFREGQGVVTEGVLEAKGQFRADTVLAKHDETYMPRDLAESLKKQGLWQHGGAAPTDTKGK